MSFMAELLNEKLLIPDLLQTAPQVRPVLDRYGLRGCGGPLGPMETLGFFAKAHDVPIERLLHEIRESMDQPAAVAEGPVGSEPQPADTIYRPFFKAGITVVLTLGAVWGAYLLLRISLFGSFISREQQELHEINAHGHAQIFGWVGLFVMGFAYQAFPRFKHASLAWPGLAGLSLWLMVIGLVCRSLTEPLVQTLGWPWIPAMGGSVLELIAIIIFIGVINRTWRSSGKPLAFYDYYILSSFAWFAIQAFYDTVYTAALFHAADSKEAFSLVATWQGPLREIQIHGFALLIILGVSQRLFHHFYGFPAPEAGLSRRVLVALNLAVVGEVMGFILMRQGGRAWAALWYGSILLLAGSVLVLVRNWRIFGPAPESDRSLKFLRTAYVWLLISLGMLVLLPAYQWALLPWLSPESAGIRFSHAYYGAIRHAITVGFVSLMIVGVSAKVVPTLNGVDVHALSPLWLPFALLNSGCALRVTAQTMTDFTANAYLLTGISGLLEVAGLAIWGVHLWLIMSGKAPLRAQRNRGSDLLAGLPIQADHRVGDVLDRYPFLLEVFLSFGFKPLANPFLRRTLARHITIAGACRTLGVALPDLLAALNSERDKKNGTRIALPMAPLD